MTEPIEDEVSTLEGVKSMSSSSSEGRAMVMLEYDYGTDMDEAYENLKKKMDSLERRLPDDVETSVMEMNNNSSATMSLTVAHDSEPSLYDYVDQKVVPELKKISSVADVEAMGGSSEYIRIELQSEKMAQYKVTVDQITSALSAASLAYPSGDTVAGNLELSVSTSMENDTLNDLKRVPITTGSGKIVYLEDIASTMRQRRAAAAFPATTARKLFPFPLKSSRAARPWRCPRRFRRRWPPWKRRTMG